MHMDTQKTLLEKVDLFQVIFIIHLTGLLIQPKLDLVIPLYHPFLNAVLMKIVLTAKLRTIVSALPIKPVAKLRAEFFKRLFPINQVSSF